MNPSEAGCRAGEPARLAYVTCEPCQPVREDDRPSAEVPGAQRIDVESVAWDDPEVRWGDFDRVVIGSVRNYSGWLDEFLAWADRVGPKRLRNSPELIRWNSDKRYLAELDGSGLPVPPTLLVAPHGPVPELHGEVVVKPVVGAGAGNTGRFTPGARGEMLLLLDRLGDRDEIAMIQPYLDEIEQAGETGLVFFGGNFAYAVKKRGFPEADRVAPTEDGPEPRSVINDETLARPGEADPAEIGLGLRTAEWLTGKFGRTPLYLRIDTLMTRQGPVIMEVKAIEAGLCLNRTTGPERPGADLLADALLGEFGLT